MEGDMKILKLHFLQQHMPRSLSREQTALFKVLLLISFASFTNILFECFLLYSLNYLFFYMFVCFYY